MNFLPQRSQIFNLPIDQVTLIQTLQISKDFILEKKTHQIVTLNSLMVNQSFKDKGMCGILQRADLVVADSVGIFWAMKFLGKPLPKVIPGIDLMLELCKMSEREGYRIYLLGAKEEIVEKTVFQLKKMFPQLKIIGHHHGYFSPAEEKKIIREIKDLSLDILFVGLGSPRQEKWISAYLKELDVNLAIGVGGSFDIISGKLKRAPVRLRRMSLEWLYRCYQEPWRIKRIIHLPVFIFRVILSRILTN
ncbi:MAG TPA: glycosyltransferase [Elusimicrobia bacterium]|jgi:N-acetylglucosaminyldiphosphoundecaprenol N-acetyl-beta-D-mannosaminyltransferase|nr:glycosyltransferase [Elusimicrobiota bacterium]